MRNSHRAAKTVCHAAFVNERKPRARVGQGPFRGQTYSRHVLTLHTYVVVGVFHT